MSQIYAAAAREHAADLVRAAEEWRHGSSSRAAHHGAADAALGAAADAFDGAPTVALRVAHPDEAPVVRRLAAMDDAPALEGETLLALIDGEAVAALSLKDGRVVANPFVRTADAVALLRLRGGHLRDGKRRPRWRRPSLRPRFA